MSLRRRDMSAENFGGFAALNAAAMLSNLFVCCYVGVGGGLVAERFAEHAEDECAKDDNDCCDGDCVPNPGDNKGDAAKNCGSPDDDMAGA